MSRRTVSVFPDLTAETSGALLILTIMVVHRYAAVEPRRIIHAVPDTRGCGEAVEVFEQTG